MKRNGINVVLRERQSADGSKIYYSISKGKKFGLPVATGIFTWTRPTTQAEKDFNQEQKEILKQLQAQETIDHQNNPDGYIPRHKLKSNFVEVFEEYVKAHPSDVNRSLPSTYSAFMTFMNDRTLIQPNEITADVCMKFRNWLLKKYNGETPSGYFSKFKHFLNHMTDQHYYRKSPATGIAAKSNPKIPKDILDEAEFLMLMNSHFSNPEIKKAVIISGYSGLSYGQVRVLRWEEIKAETIEQIRPKTGKLVVVPISDVIREYIGERGKKTGLILNLPSNNGVNKALKKWYQGAGLNKHITWHCLRHTAAVLWASKGVPIATVAGLLGHTTTKLVHSIYQHSQNSEKIKAVKSLPSMKTVATAENVQAIDDRMPSIQRVKILPTKEEKMQIEMAYVDKMERMGLTPEEIRQKIDQM